MISLPNATTIAQSVAASHGLNLDAEALSAAATRLAADLAVDKGRQLAFDCPVPFRIERGDVVDVTPLEHALAIVRKHGRPVTALASTPATPTAKPAKPEMNTSIAAFGRALAAQHDMAIAQEAATWPNPFIAGPNYNRTRQAIISKHNPARAARLKAEAGK